MWSVSLEELGARRLHSSGEKIEIEGTAATSIGLRLEALSSPAATSSRISLWFLYQVRKFHAPDTQRRDVETQPGSAGLSCRRNQCPGSQTRGLIRSSVGPVFRREKYGSAEKGLHGLATRLKNRGLWRFRRGEIV